MNHEILYAVLNKYSVPKNLTQVIRTENLYSECAIHLEVQKEKRTISYVTGV